MSHLKYTEGFFIR